MPHWITRTLVALTVGGYLLIGGCGEASEQESGGGFSNDNPPFLEEAEQERDEAEALRSEVEEEAEQAEYEAEEEREEIESEYDGYGYWRCMPVARRVARLRGTV